MTHISANKYPRNRAILSGLISFTVFACIFFASSENFVGSMLLSILPGFTVAFAAGWLSERDKRKQEKEKRMALIFQHGDTVDYMLEKINSHMSEILRLSKKIDDQKMQEKLRGICKHARKVLEKIDEHRPKSRLEYYTSVEYRLNLVVKGMPQYLEMQDPENHIYFPDWNDRLETALRKATNLEGAFIVSVRTLEKGDLDDFDMFWDLMDPLDPVIQI